MIEFLTVLKEFLSEIKVFLTMLFFSSSLILTPIPIDIGKEWVELAPKKPLTAITGGATLYLDVTKNVIDINDTEALGKKFPRGTIEAELSTENGEPIKLINNSAYAISNNTVSMIMDSNSAMPTKTKFIKVRLKSAIKLKSVTVTWKNFSL